MRGDARIIYIGVSLLVCALAAGALLYLKTGVRDRLDRDFGLSGTPADFAFQCFTFSRETFGISDQTRSWDFCGCLATDMAGSLSEEELEFAEDLTGPNGLGGFEVPTVTAAETDIERRVAMAFQQGFLACRGHLDPRP